MIRWGAGLFFVIGVVVLALAGCASVGQWAPRGPNSECRPVRPLLGMRQGYQECRSRVCINKDGKFAKMVECRP